MFQRLAPLVLFLASCAITNGFDGYDPVPRFDPSVVSGTVDGLDVGETVTLLLNGASAIDVGNGAFSFPPVLAKASPYVVDAQPDTTAACSVDHGSGVATSDVTNVAVHCVSTDAALSSLSISGGVLSPAFNPAVLDYAATVRGRVPTLTPATTTVTAIASRASATLDIANVPTLSGTASAPIAFAFGPNLPIIIAVSAPDGKHSVTYSITLTGTVVEDLLTAPVPYDASASPGSGFGAFQDLAASANTLVIGAPGESSNAGAAFVYLRSETTWVQQAYIKASNPKANDRFGTYVSLSGDTLAVGATGDASDATGIDGDETDTSMPAAGAVHVFVRSGSDWTKQAFIKPSDTKPIGIFGTVSLSGDTLAVGARGMQAVYVFTRSGTTWTQQARITPASMNTAFGWAVSLSGDTLAVGASDDSSNATGINGNESDSSALYSGAVYVFARIGNVWSKQAYIKASNTRRLAEFGRSVSLSTSGNTLAVGSPGESSIATGIDGDQTDMSRPKAGAVYVFQRSGTTWSQQAYIKPLNTPLENTLASDTPPSISSYFGETVTLVDDVLAVGAWAESGGALGINGDQYDNSAYQTMPGAVFMFSRSGVTWTQAAYAKAFEPTTNFGGSIALTSDTLCVGSNMTFWSTLIPVGWILDAGAVHCF